MRGYPQFSFWIPVAFAKICFSRIVINRAKILRYYICSHRPKVVFQVKRARVPAVYLRLHALPLSRSSHFVCIQKLNLFLLEYGVQVHCYIANIHQKSSGVSSPAETLLQLCDIIANNGTSLD